MRLSFTNFDPARQSRSPDAIAVDPSGASFRSLLESHMGREVSVRLEGDAPPAVAAPAGQARGQDVADFLELYDTREFVFPDSVLERIREMRSVDPEGEAGAPPPEPERMDRFREGLLSPEEQYLLLRKLIEDGLVSREDVCNANTTVYPDTASAAGYLHREEGFQDILRIPPGDYTGRLRAMSENERFAYEHIRREYGRSCESILRYEASHNSLRSALCKITGREEE